MSDSTTVVEDGFGFLKNPETGNSEIIRRYTLRNVNSVEVQVISYGATITSIKCPDKKRRIHDVVLGFDDIEGYVQNQPAYFGATIGRVANRISNGRFRLGTKEYEVSKNAGDFQLHGGKRGFDQVFWESYTDGSKVVFTYVSKDGDEGYPGDLMTQVTYSLSDENGLKLAMTAMTTKPTPVNLTNHVYFNLAGHCAGPKALFDHYASINADKILVTTPQLIPTGEIRKVGGTIYDLRSPRHLGTVIPEVPGGGYDNTMCINGTKEEGIRFVARVYHPPSGRVVEVFSDQPGLQWYTSRNLPDPDAIKVPSQEVAGEIPQEIEAPQDASADTPPEMRGKDGALYYKYGAFCLETQNYPDAVNHRRFPDSILRPGEIYKHTCIYRFGLQK
ncbi:hypothetical protein L9F63_017362 [Diploptera punctata]|uniref:Aldose 1-epimerase n=1 Tax=Diploptera punctata TaxID=6984 RepID=A0AAD7ZZ46_DIPPU|nr:hypothetical protein L9F63_017362 [Diploptera punctata]